MEVIINPTAEAASKLAARKIATVVRANPNAVLGLATGGSPVAVYRELIRLHRDEGLDFSGVTTFNLDEYVGLGPTHPASYCHFMWEHLFKYLNVERARVHIPDGLAADVPASCKAYEAAIRDAGGIDLQLLGIGTDGHIAFNEPASSLASRTRIKTLTERTRRDNAAFFADDEEVPHHVITMGVGTIMEAKEVILLGFGSAKADAMAAAIEGPVTQMVPASVLQFHEHACFLLDEASAAKLQRAEYYRHVFANKPAWQRV
jgi:glucosamine-6-phosphate deaminase